MRGCRPQDELRAELQPDAVGASPQLHLTGYEHAALHKLLASLRLKRGEVEAAERGSGSTLTGHDVRLFVCR